MTNPPLIGKNILITGASSGIALPVPVILPAVDFEFFSERLFYAQFTRRTILQPNI